MLLAGNRLAARAQAQHATTSPAVCVLGQPQMRLARAALLGEPALVLRNTRGGLLASAKALQVCNTMKTPLEAAPMHLRSQQGAVVIKFHVTANNARGLRVVGNIPSLGNWQPEQGMAMERTADHMWSAALVLPDDFKGCIEFKAVDMVAPDHAIWEPGQNRRLQVAGAASAICMTVLDVTSDWGVEGLKVELCEPTPEMEQAALARKNGNHQQEHHQRPTSPPTRKQPQPGDQVPCRILLTLTDPLPANQQYVLVGSAPELGAWNVEQGVHLEPQGSHTLAADAKLPCGQELEYKVVTVRPGAAPEWESGSNRMLPVPVPPAEAGPGRVAVLLHMNNPAMAHTVFEQSCQGDVGPLRVDLPTTCLITVPQYELEPGQQLVLVGSLPELGNWLPEAGLVLGSAGQGYWQAQMELPIGTQAEAKLVVRDTMGAVHWETGPNRLIDVSGGCQSISRHATSATSCITLLPNAGTSAPTVVFPVFPPVAETETAAVASQEHAANNGTIANNMFAAHSNAKSNGSSQNGSRSNGAVLPRTDEDPQVTKDLMKHASKSEQSTLTTASANGVIPPMQQLQQLEDRLARLKANLLGAAEGHWGSEQKGKWKSMLQLQDEKEQPPAKTTPEHERADDQPQSEQQQTTEASAPHQQRQADDHEKREETNDVSAVEAVADTSRQDQQFVLFGQAAQEDEMHHEDEHVIEQQPESVSAVTNENTMISEPPASVKDEAMTIGRPRSSKSKTSPAKSPKAAYPRCPEGMEPYESHVMAILGACSSRRPEQLPEMIQALGLPPTYDKSQAELNSLLSYMVAKGTLSVDAFGYYSLNGEMELEPVPRRQRSPRRSVSPATDETGEHDHEAEHSGRHSPFHDVGTEVVAEKRGRGRPRKSPLAPTDSDAHAVEKRGRGRPRTRSLSGSPGLDESGVKRGRGRPRKVAIPADDSQDTNMLQEAAARDLQEVRASPSFFQQYQYGDNHQADYGYNSSYSNNGVSMHN